ncbi:MAG: DUF3822 family protein [Cytophagales bacterium]|nr:DUF3822 family protein [Cytophagales bacterium]
MPLQEVEIAPEIKIVDEKYFNVDNLSDYHLQLAWSPAGMDFCVVDSRNNRCLYLEENKLDDFMHTSSDIEWLEALFDTHHFLKAGFWKSIQLSIKNEKFTLIPSPLFKQECAKEYLQFNCHIKANEEVSFFFHKSLNITSVFAYPVAVVEWLKLQYPHRKLNLVHHTSSFLEGIMRETSGDTECGVYANIENDLLTLIVKKGNTIEFCNNFIFKTNEDILYYQLFVLEQLKLNRSTTPITYWGNVDQESGLFLLLSTYIRQIEVGVRPSMIFYSYVFDELPEQRHFDLLSMKLCL